MVTKSLVPLLEPSKVVKLLCIRDFQRLASTIQSKLEFCSLFCQIFQVVYNILFLLPYSAKEYQEVNLEKIQEYVEKGKLVPANDKMLNMRDLVLAGIINNPKDGVKLLAKVIHYSFMFVLLLPLLINIVISYREKKLSRFQFI